jgi:hypothetical protein
MVVAGGLSVKALGPSGLRVASMSLSFGCHHSLIVEADKLTLRQNINVKVPHAVMVLMNGEGHKSLTSSGMAHYQGLLCENPQVRLETV